MKLPSWLEATNRLAGVCESLPARFPRPDSLVSPRTEAELEAWKKSEVARRKRLDGAVREWLTHGQWPSGLDATDGYLISIRIAAARDWLDVGHVGLVAEADPVAILETLLIDGWEESLAEQHWRRLDWGVSAYFCGRESAGSFTE